MMAGSRRFYTLDALRGLAAIAVVILHAPAIMSPLAMPSGGLAVDLFFMMSGFVVARAYTSRLARDLSFWSFVKIRLIRLYPLWLVGCLIGIAAAAASALSPTGNWAWADIAWSAPYSLLILPTPGSGPLFPLNAVGWSLFFEIVVNFAYALFWRQLSSVRSILVIIAASATIFLVAAALHGDGDLGSFWRTFIGGAARATFGFFVGVALDHAVRSGRFKLRADPLLLIGACVALFALPRGPWTLLTDMVSVLIVLPLVVLAAVQTNVHARLQSTFSILGGVSYALYAIHKPLVYLATVAVGIAATRGFNIPNPLAGLVVLAGLLLTAWGLDRAYDEPMRRLLSRRLLRNKTVSPLS